MQKRFHIRQTAVSLLLIAVGEARPAAAAFQGELLWSSNNEQAILAGSSLLLPIFDELFFAAAANSGRFFPHISSRRKTNHRGSSSPSTTVSHMLPPISKVLQVDDTSTSSYYASYKTTDNENYQYVYDYDTQPISSTILLTREEEELFQLVKRVRDKYCPNTTIRVAGGWVRDKLLCRHATSRDVDFVLSNISGGDFARLFREYVNGKSENDVNTAANNNDNIKTSSEPPALLKEYDGTTSKHLQTASIQFRDFGIDFCNLRFEKYSPDSRVPEETRIASAVEDAWRRDLTINSLFYNLNSNQVEDFTEQGLQDLQLRRIATTKAPLETLLQDPLRIVRAIRFAAKLSFSMDPALKKAATDPRVREALQRKVSKARIGNEIDAVFQTRDPTCGVQLLLETNLMSVVFPLGNAGDNSNNSKNNQSSWKLKRAGDSALTLYKAACRSLCRTQALVSRIFVQGTEWDENRRRYLWHAAFFKPFCDQTVPCQPSLGGKRSRRQGSILFHLLTHGLKRTTYDTATIGNVIKGVDVLETFVRQEHGGESTELQSLLTLEDDEEARVNFAILSKNDPQWEHTTDLRWMGYKILKQVGPFWRESLILLLAEQQDLTEAVQRYRQWVTLIVDQLGLEDAMIFGDRSYSKSLLNGSQIQQRALPGVHGEGFKQIMEAQEEWQVRHGCSGGTVGKHREAELIHHLVATFPEYATDPAEDSSSAS